MVYDPRAEGIKKSMLALTFLAGVTFIVGLVLLIKGLSRRT